MFDRSAVRRAAVRGSAWGFCVAVGLGCGGKAILETDAAGGARDSVGGAGGAGGAGGTGGAGAMPVDCVEAGCGAPCEITPGQGNTGVCTEFGDCAYDTQCPIGPCENKLCGDGCTVCNDVECLMGRCTANQECVPDDVACPGG